MVGTKRKEYKTTLSGQKLKKVEAAKKRKLNSETWMSICKNLEVDRHTLRDWMYREDELRESVKGDKSCHHGRIPIIQPIKQQLLHLMSVARGKGMPVNIDLLILHASEFLPEFAAKTRKGKEMITRRFLKQNRYSIRAVTHQSQEDSEVTRQNGISNAAAMHPLQDSIHCHPDYIINMDHTAVFHAIIPSKTLNPVGSKSFNVRKFKGATKRVTVMLAVTESGKKLDPMVVFKGKRTAKRKNAVIHSFGSVPSGTHYTAQDKAYTDEVTLMEWITKVLEPYITTSPPGVHPVLFMDSFRCRILKSVAARHADLGVRLEIILGG
jgi:DDE superfamily endonuclease